MDSESVEERSRRILKQLQDRYPGKKAYDSDGRGLHFICEVEPTSEHHDYDRAVEVILLSTPHMHQTMTQYYSILSGTLELHVDDKVIILNPNDKYVVSPGVVHWAKSDNESWAEIHSEPGRTPDDHIAVAH